MKILHVGSGSGTASVLSNICNRLGHTSMVISDSERYNFSKYYGNTYLMDSKSDVKEQIKLYGEDFDHIVYHDEFKLAIECDSMHIPSSYMFHGESTNIDPIIPDRIQNLESIDNIFATNESLQRKIKGAELFNTPIDMDLFKPMKLKKKNIAFGVLQRQFKNDVYKYFRSKNLNIGIYTAYADKINISYEKMPILLNSFKYYVDVRFNNEEKPSIVREMSTIGRQALACGIPVITWSGWVYTLSPSYYDENVAKEFIRVITE